MSEEKTESEKKVKVDPDFVHLLTVADSLLMSMNTGVVMAAASLILHLAPTGCIMVDHAVYTLVQLLNRDYYSSYVILNTIDELSALDPTMFAPYVRVRFEV